MAELGQTRSEAAADDPAGTASQAGTEVAGDNPAGDNPAGAAESPAVTTLTPTGRVILGMIAFGKQTGYDIKQIVDRSTRHFWAASYGQIYPELRRLEAQGLVVGRPEPSGGRSRTVYELTEAGRTALQGWLEAESTIAWELRDEGMLKLFFSDLTDPEHRLENIRRMRTVQERKREQLKALQAAAGEMRPGPSMTLELGLRTTQWLIEWCQEIEQRLSEQQAAS